MDLFNLSIYYYLINRLHLKIRKIGIACNLIVFTLNYIRHVDSHFAILFPKINCELFVPRPYKINKCNSKCFFF